MEHYHIIVSGHVQGVGFRYFTQAAAMENSLCGWVKNNDNGTVEIELCGDQKSFDQFLIQLKQGPRYAQVDDIFVEKVENGTNHSNFLILN